MTITLDDLKGRVGHEIGVSRWFEIDQTRIDAFADVTEDRQFIHVDPAKAQVTPFGSTIAHGFLTLSMLSLMAEDALPRMAGLAHSLNYGFNRIRFVAPVRSGARIRGRFTLTGIEPVEGGFTQTMDVSIEIENFDKPAIVAEWLTRQYFA